MNSPAPSPRRPAHAAFEFTGHALEGRHLRLRYALRGGPDPDIAFEEQLWLPDALPAPAPDDPVVQALLDACHRVFGVSYFKAAIPRQVIAPPVAPDDAAFWDTLYTIGMGEFYCRNDIDPRGRVHFPSSTSQATQAPSTQYRSAPVERALVLIGGGKDSAVAAEVVRHARVPAEALALGQSPWIAASAAAAGLRLNTIRRQLDPKLFELNRRGAWNGHVPISACIAFVALLVGRAAGCTDILVGNEYGADEGNTVWNGLVINHQWSKSLVFERALKAWCARNGVTTPTYFSMVRPLTEMAIAAAFARHPAHFDAFTSCNANFRQPGATDAARWCGHCPKCVFVQLMLRPWLDDATAHHIFGGDFLADPQNLALLEELTGLRQKPWECVGTPAECGLALALLDTQGKLRGAARDWLATHRDVLPADVAAAERAMLTPRDDHCLPPAWQERLHAYLGAHR